MTGLYFYKLVSPYENDVTKNCKLTVNEIDHNFITLKDADINDANYDVLSNKITLTRNNGESMEVDLTPIVDDMTTNLEVDYDSICGTITISYNDKKIVIDGIVTKDNLSKEILTEVDSDSSLKGNGTDGCPLGLSLVEYTGMYRPAKKFINVAKGEFLPKPEHLSYGDSFVTYEKINDYGLLYNFHAVKNINEDLSHGWRIPTKEDWDNMLNAIEPCDKYKTHSSALANTILGKFAGKLLKKKFRWFDNTNNPCDDIKHHCECDCHEEKDNFFCDNHIDGNDFFDADEVCKRELKKKHIDPRGVDAYKLGILPAGYGDGCKIMAYFGKRGEYWTSTITNSLDIYTKRFDYDKSGVIQNLESPSSLYSIRLVKDYNGHNYREVESINGQDYPTVLMPSENTKHGFSIWTAMNLSFHNPKYHPVLPNHGECLDAGTQKLFFLYTWNGKDFIKKQIKEGEAIVLEHGLRGEYNGEYRLIHGKLVNTSDVVLHDVMHIIDPRLDKIEGRLDEKDEQIEEINNEIESIKIYQNDLTIKLEQEILDRKEVDKEIQEKLDAEIESRLQSDAEQWEAIDNEITKRQEEVTRLDERVDAEITKRQEEVTRLDERVDSEIAKRKEEDNILHERVDAEITKRQEEVARLDERVDSEIAKRKEEDARLDERIDNEISKRQEEDARLDERVNAEISKRQEEDARLDERIDNEISKRKEEDNILHDRVDNEISKRKEEDARLDERIDNEISKRKEEDELIKEQLITGGTFSNEEGVLILQTNKEDNNIIITIDGNYGTF